MNKKFIKFDDTEIEEFELQKYKSPNSIKDIDINEIVVSNCIQVSSDIQVALLYTTNMFSYRTQSFVASDLKVLNISTITSGVII